MSNDSADNCIRLSFPVNAAYVSSARLTASSIANRMRFDIDEIEDIKTAVSEACTYIIKMLAAPARGSFEIQFVLDGDRMDIEISAPGALVPANTDDMSLIMIGAMVDRFEIVHSGGPLGILISMSKSHKASIFG